MKLKLLFIYGELGGGGAERVLLDLLANLDRNRYEVDLCIIVNGGVLLPEVPAFVNIIPLYSTYTWQYKLALRLSKWGISNYLFKRVLFKKISKKYDVEISFLEGMPLKLHALLSTKTKKLTWVHCDLFNFHYTKCQFYANEEVKAYNKMDKVVCVSNDSLVAFNQRFPNCDTEKKVIYNPLDIEKIKLLAREFHLNKENRFTIIFVGRLTLPKQPQRIIRLAAKFKKANIRVHFQIIGDGELKEDLKNLAKKLDVLEMVEFLGFVKNPYPNIKKADLLLSCSAYEGFGLVICEAMCLGTAVVATKTAGPTEIIQNNKYGIICEQNEEAIYEAVLTMIQDKELRQYYQRVGFERANDFSVNNTVREFDILISNMLAK